MEVHFNRDIPADDRFEVKVENLQGVILRRERYNRDDVEKAYRELFAQPRQLAEGEKEDPEQAASHAKFEARWAKIAECFTKSKEAEKK